MSRRVSEGRVLAIQGEAEHEMAGGEWFAGRLFGMREGPTIEEVRDLCLDLREQAPSLDYLTKMWERVRAAEQGRDEARERTRVLRDALEIITSTAREVKAENTPEFMWHLQNRIEVAVAAWNMPPLDPVRRDEERQGIAAAAVKAGCLLQLGHAVLINEGVRAGIARGIATERTANDDASDETRREIANGREAR